MVDIGIQPKKRNRGTERIMIQNRLQNKYKFCTVSELRFPSKADLMHPHTPLLHQVRAGGALLLTVAVVENWKYK